MEDDEPVAGKQGPLPTREPRVDGGSTTTVVPPTGEAWRHAFRDRVKEQLGLRGMVQFPSVATGAPSRQSVKVPSAPGHSAGATEPSRGGASVR